MPRVPKVYLRDILDSIRKIERYKGRVNQASFKSDKRITEKSALNYKTAGLLWFCGFAGYGYVV